MARNKASDDVDTLRAQLSVALSPKQQGVDARLRRQIERLISTMPPSNREIFMLLLQLIGD